MENKKEYGFIVSLALLGAALIEYVGIFAIVKVTQYVSYLIVDIKHQIYKRKLREEMEEELAEIDLKKGEE